MVNRPPDRMSKSWLESPLAITVSALPRAGNAPELLMVTSGGVGADPLPRVAEHPFLDLGQRAVGIRAHVQQQVAALRHGLDEHRRVVEWRYQIV